MPPRKKAKDTTMTLAPEGASIAYLGSEKRLDNNEWGELSNDLYQGVNAALSERSALEQNLKDWTDLYEMRTQPTDWPWVGASNVFIPVIPAQLDTAVAYIVGKTFVPRFYIVSGNTADAAAKAHDVERYYNAELVRQRGQTTWYDQYITWLHLAFRDGTAVMEALWRKSKTKRRVVTFEPAQNEGVPVVDAVNGEATPRMERKIQEVEVIDYDDVELQPVLLRDFLLIPSEATSIEQAVGVARAVWLYEDQLNAMVNEGIFDKKETERALAYDPVGNSEIASDRQGSYDKTAGDQIVPGLAQGAQTSKFFGNRGPLKVWRIHTRQYDMDGDGVPEENIFWLHEISQRLLGWMPYEYIVPGRPFFAFSPYPRPDRFYGYSLCERLAPIQAEVNGMWNGRNNLFDLMLQPPLMYLVGDELDDQDEHWGPGTKWPVSQKGSIEFMTMPNVPIEHFQNEATLNTYVDKLTGISAPLMGVQSSGRRTATEMKQQAASATTRNDLIAMRLRIVCRAIFDFIHHLKLQYLNNDPEFQEAGQKYTLPREVLALDYQLDISGSADPLDTATRRQENLGLFQLLAQVPFIAQDQVKMYNLVRMMLDAFNRPEALGIIGTEEEAQQRQQAMQQQQQQQQQLQALGMLMGQKPGGGQQQKPQQPGQQQQQGQHPQAPKPH